MSEKGEREREKKNKVERIICLIPLKCNTYLVTGARDGLGLKKNGPGPFYPDQPTQTSARILRPCPINAHTNTLAVNTTISIMDGYSRLL